MLRFTSTLMLFAVCLGHTTTWAQTPIPEFFGIYALSDGTLTELLEDDNLNNLEPDVEFVIHWRGNELNRAVKMFYIPPEQPKESNSGEFTGWDNFGRQLSQFTERNGRLLEWGVGLDAVEVPFRMGPYGGSSEMVRVVPVQDLSPGLYQLLKGGRFWVRKAQVLASYTKAAGADRATTGGTGVTTKFGIDNRSGHTIQVFLDGNETPLATLRHFSNYTGQLEVGSTHTIRVELAAKFLAPAQVFRTEFTVPRVMRDITVTGRGLRDCPGRC